MSPERIQYGHVNSKYEVIGTATLTVTAASEPSPYSTRWQESISVFAGAMSPINPGTRPSLRSTCTECIKGPPAWGDGPAQRTRISYEDEALSINTTPVITHGNWAGPLLCCDG
ncbi:hypothetical protein [Streptomyces noursei]|uniref:hypothetical protein n=1 Tax=Streptomyces noursei TaxID=1971 RepID=UPI001962B5A1|nr:hypothetical protein [Streptomyces noursei]QRX90206.1 hypothetical protein JNO44_04435 [Streptomyces noursei]